MKKYVYIILLSSCFFSYYFSFTRSPFRAPDPRMPYITSSWVNDSKKHTLHSHYLRFNTIFNVFDENYFYLHTLPHEISYRYNKQQTVQSALLTQLIEELLKQMENPKIKSYSHFTVLQDKDYKQTHGPLILEFNDYPFVLKVFKETPKSFTQPDNRSIEEKFFYYMNSSCRHLSGFTRIPNLEYVKDRIAQSSTWANIVDFPRKWYYLPENAQWIEVAGYNMGIKQNPYIKFPGTYCIIADKIVAEKKFSKYNAAEKKVALHLCNFLEQVIDAHIDNFMIEKGTKKLVIVDTEHFPTVVGFKESHKFYSYFSWYFHLASKATKDVYFTLKSEWLDPSFQNPDPT